MKGVIIINKSKRKWPSRITSIFMALVIIIAFCSISATSAKAAEKTVIGTAICTVKSRMNMRSGPSSSYGKVGSGLPGGAVVEVYTKSGNWYQFNYNGTEAWGYAGYLKFISNSPSPTLVTAAAVTNTPQSGGAYTIYYQGNSKWRFSRAVAKKACLVTAYAITINNMGIAATPRTVYQSNGNRNPMNMSKLATNFGVKAVCALDPSSGYLRSFNGYQTYINNPSANAIQAIKEVLDRNPEGVILSFRKGSNAHSIVACKYEGNAIYYSDPGRTYTRLLTFNETWVRFKHKMSYANLIEMVALDAI